MTKIKNFFNNLGSYVMEKSIHQSFALPATSAARDLPKYPPLEQITKPSVTTEEAAYYLNRKSQTLRTWACLENGPLRPVRISGRLAWPVAEIRKLLNGEAI